MSQTLQIIDAVIQRLAAALPALAVEYFPERPADYRLNHDTGALLVSYMGSQFADTPDSHAIIQPRTVRLSVTVVMRQLGGGTGAIAALDLVRQTLVGFRPPHGQKLAAVAEKFLGESAGIWQYAVDFSCECLQVEDADIGSEPLLTVVTYEEAS